METVAHAETVGGVEFVVDGGHAAGFGHVGRCLAIWEELDVPASFAVDDESARAFVAAHGAPVGARPTAPVAVLDRLVPTSLEEVSRLRAVGRAIVLVDDAGEGRAAADLLVDPPSSETWPPTGGRRLAGFEHVLLRREIRTARGTPPAGHVLLSLGGSDPAGLTPPLADALTAAGIDVVYALGPGYRGEAPRSGRPVPPETGWPSALAGASLFVCGFGHSLFEAAYLGVPSLAVVFRPDQVRDAGSFARHGTARVVDLAGAGPEQVAETALELLGDDALRLEMAARGQRLFDGRGAARVARAIERLAAA